MVGAPTPPPGGGGGGGERRRLVWLQLRCAGAAVVFVGCQSVLCWLAATRLLLPWWPLVLVAVAAAEAAFYALAWKRKHAELDAIPATHAPPDGSYDAWAFFEKWHASSSYNVRFLALAELIKCWFANTPTMEIKRGNAAELVSRGYFYKPLDALAAEGKAHLVEAMLLAIERVWGYRFEEGVNPDLAYLHHLQEPLKVSYRPLCFYLACEVGAALKHALLLAAGFRGHTFGAYTYYTLDLPTQQQAAQGKRARGQPLVFLHGVGAGLLPYIHVLLRLTALGQPIMAVEYKHLSMRWTDFIPTAPQVAADMTGMFERHGIATASLVAHSYGSFYASALLKLARDKVHSMALIDPVCCCMWSGHLISNFVYHPARSTTGLITWLIARDIHTAASVSRNFFWTDVCLWPDEIPEHSLFVLCEKDDLVPVQHVDIMLTQEVQHARVLRVPGAHHADFLLSPALQDEIIANVREMLQQPASRPSRDGVSAAAPQQLQQQHCKDAAVLGRGSCGLSSSSGGSRRRRRPSDASSDAGAAETAENIAAQDAACFESAVKALQFNLQANCSTSSSSSSFRLGSTARGKGGSRRGGGGPSGPPDTAQLHDAAAGLPSSCGVEAAAAAAGEAFGRNSSSGGGSSGMRRKVSLKKVIRRLRRQPDAVEVC